MGDKEYISSKVKTVATGVKATQAICQQPWYWYISPGIFQSRPVSFNVDFHCVDDIVLLPVSMRSSVLRSISSAIGFMSRLWWPCTLAHRAYIKDCAHCLHYVVLCCGYVTTDVIHNFQGYFTAADTMGFLPDT